MTHLTIVRRIAASPSIVWEAVTTPEGLRQWIGPDGGPVIVAQSNPKVGGRFRLRFRMLDGSEHESSGEYLEVDPPRRLVMSWKWLDEDAPVSRVEIVLREIDGGTELTFTHAKLPDEATRDSHRHGWDGAIDKLEAMFASLPRHFPHEPGAQRMTETRRDLPPPAELAAKVSQPFPNEPDGYRKARQALLAEEIAVRRQLWRVAEQRRALPLGGEPRAYEFVDQDGKTVKLADLFGRHDTLVTYFWMYGPKRERPCPMCTSFLGSIDIPARDIEQRVSFAVIGRSPVSRQLAFARERGWRHLKFFQCVGDDFARDYRGLHDDGSEWPILAVWSRRGDNVHLFWAAESGGTQDPGQDPHGAPEIAPLWNILDLTPGGRGTDWYPKLDY